ncbi:unnamed protein product [Trypanosoma congolense IL3000]|uniref:WGS project CAEQ00000000 data, annotated contig 1974 n=1 Tax=Trypanosoma congolense (strain IL3000) TaxID=1068625 RepID=F9WAH3_TRYCI|nr:unnamed protein product [Trypanosoma congolense IL3000]
MSRSYMTVWCLALVLLAATGANCLYKLELMQVVHRSGVAPPPMATPDREKLCSPNGKSNCAAIANRGVQQLKDMGAHIAELYEQDGETEDSKTWLSPPYDPTAVYSQSLGSPVATRAATALLSGIYGAEEGGVAPVIISAAPSTDTLLNVNALPSFVLENESGAEEFAREMEKVVSEQFPDASVIGDMGKEVGMGDACSAANAHVWCCHRLQQLVTMYSTVPNGGDGAPTVMKHAAQLQAVAAARNSALYGYVASDSLSAARGSLGQPLAQELLLGMRRKMLQGGDANHNHNRVMHYAHDTPIHTVLGHEATNAVPLAETFLIDLLRDSATGVYFVRLRYLAVETKPEASPAVASFPFRCLNAAGEPSATVSGDATTCPFDDFVRFVDSSKGASGVGAACHLEADTEERLQCRTAGPPTSPQCAQYRALCPAHACPDRHIYDVTSDFCSALDSDLAVLTNGVLTSLCISLLFAGIMLGVILVEMYPVAFSFKTVD